MENLISVIIPVYNVDKYLNKCIESVIHQTYTNLEIILIDDGSTDSCPEICDLYESMDRRIKVIHKENGGLSDARNSGLNIMSGEYFTCIDSDDFVEIDYIEYLYNLIIESNSDISICNHTFVSGDNSKNIYHSNVEDVTLSPVEAMKNILYQKIFTHSAWAKLYKSSILGDIRYPVGQLYEDIVTTSLLVSHSKKIIYGHKSKYFYNLRQDGIMKKPFNLSKLDILNQIENLRILLEGYEKSLLIPFKSFELSMCFHVFFQIPSNPEYEMMKKNIYTRIKQNRIYVMFDRNTRMKNRLGSILSLLGYGIISRIGR